MSVSVVLENVASSIGEGPHWDPATRRLYHVDIWAGDVHRWDYTTNTNTKIHLDDSVGFVVPHKDNGVVVGLGRTLAHVDWDTQKVTTLAEVDQGTRNRFNDGKCDPSGRLWAGTMGAELEPARPELEKGGLFSLDRDRKLRQHLSGISISNGLAWTDDVMYYIDTPPRKIYAFDYENATGNISNQRVAIDFGKGTEDTMGFPDGMCIDDEGKLWVACFGIGRINRFDPQTGQVIQHVDVPARWPTSCCFGGPNMDELYVTSSKSAFTNKPEINSDKPLGGSVFKVTGLGVKGTAPPAFQGEDNN